MGQDNLRACAKTTSHFRIPASGYLRPRLNRKTLEIVLLFLWFCSIGTTKSDPNLGANSAKLFLRRPSDEGVDPFVAAMEGLADAMIEVGDLYNERKCFAPELLLCSDALYAGLDILRPAIEASGRESEAKGSIVLGVVEGDVHDIGKNLAR